ncbi:MAG: hypothetical protein SGILL_010171, partial [Bacillariaceae sp.]
AMVQQLREEGDVAQEQCDLLQQLVAQSKDRIMGLNRETSSKVSRPTVYRRFVLLGKSHSFFLLLHFYLFQAKSFNKAETAYEALVLEEKRRVKAVEAKLDKMRKERDDATAERDARKSNVEKLAVLQPKIQAHLAKKNKTKVRDAEIEARQDELSKLKATLAEKTAEVTKRQDAAAVRIQDTQGAVDALAKLCGSYGDQEKDAKEKLSQREQKKAKLLSMIEKVETNIENQRIGHEDELLALEQENGNMEASIADLESVKAAKRVQRKELFDERAVEKLAMEEEIDGKKKRAQNLRMATDATTGKESLFRLSVLQEGAKMVKEAQEDGELDFTL